MMPQVYLKKNFFCDFFTHQEHITIVNSGDAQGGITIEEKNYWEQDDFSIRAKHGANVKENEKIKWYFDIVRELRKKTPKITDKWGWQWYQLLLAI